MRKAAASPDRIFAHFKKRAVDDCATELTRILDDVNRGDTDALGRLANVVYEELHRLAAAQMGHERADHTLQPTALVSEAFLRLFGNSDTKWENRAHFFGAAAEAMRRILVDYARRKQAHKRGGPARRVPLSDADGDSGHAAETVLAVDEALSRLTEVDPAKGRVVELRYFCGLSTEETARVLDVTPRTVERHWTTARAWLAREIGGD